MALRVTAYFVLIFGMPAMRLAAEHVERLRGPGSGWLATAIPLANLAVFTALVLASTFPRKWLHLLGGAIGTVVLYFAWIIVFMVLNPEAAFDGIQ